MFFKKKLRYQWYRFLWDNAPTLPLRKMPVHLDLEVTSRCNLACIMCPHGEKEKDFGIGDMPLDLAKALIKEGAGRIKSIKLNWRGEPTLYKELPQLIAWAKEHKYVEVMINTNLNCKAERLTEIVHAGIDKIIVSIDSFDEHIYAQIRKGGNLRRVLQNIDLLKELKRTRAFDLVIQARRQKLNELEVFPPDVLVKSATQRTGTGDYICAGERTIGRSNCYMPLRRLLVSWDGKVFPCCADWFEKGCLGIIDQRSTKNLLTIWHEAVIRKLRRGLEDRSVFEHEPCKSCVSRESYQWTK